MPRGYGMGRGYWRAYGGGMGRGHMNWSRVDGPDTEVSGYEYVGPCRCGWGPNAYYRTGEGRTVHASAVASVRSGPASNGKSDLEILRADNERLAARMRELEEKLASQ